MKNIKLQWLLLFTIIMIIAMNFQWNLDNKHVQKGIIALEFAKTSTEAKNIITDWNIPGAIENTYLDALFIISYSLFLFFAVYRTAEQLKGPANYFKYLAWLAPLAGLLDFIENYMLLQFLKDPANFQSTHTISMIKFGIALGLLALFIFLSSRLVDEGKKRLY
ncbi:MAG: hypothetical protein ABIW47_00800 [Ginsengibacter sp.]